MKWLTLLLVMSVAFAQVRVVDTDMGYVEVEGISDEGNHYELQEKIISLRAESLKDFVALNYSVRATPRNLEKIAEEFGYPLSGPLGQQVASGLTFGETVELPEMVCGTYRLSGEAYYEVNGTKEVFRDEIVFKKPCKDIQSRLIYGIVSRVPYPILQRLMGLVGIRFG